MVKFIQKTNKICLFIFMFLAFLVVSACSLDHEKQEVTTYTVTFKVESTEELLTTITNPVTTRIKEKDIVVDGSYIPDGYGYTWYSYVNSEYKEVKLIDINYTTTVYLHLVAKEYSVKFYDGANLLSKVGYNVDETVVLPTPSKDGYKFLGWYSDQELTEKVESFVMGASDASFYAKWEKTATAKKVHFVYGNVDIEVENAYPGEHILKIEAPQKEGYDFVGWYKDAELTEEFDFEHELMPESDISIYAKYEKATYTVTLVSGVSGFDLTEKSFKYGELITGLFTEAEEAYLATLSDYTFSGWYLDSGLTEKLNVLSMPAQDITLYAKWQVEGLTLYVQDKVYAVVKGQVGDDISTQRPADPQVDGYEFGGWFDSFGQEFVFDVLPSNNVEVHAKLTPITYTISYDADGGELENQILSYNVETPSFTLAIPSKSGYTFLGWKNQYGQTISEVALGSTGNLELTAQWRINGYNVRYYVDGKLVHTDSYQFGDEVVKYAEPTKVGYTFSGWSTIPANMPAVDVRVDGTFTINQYTITFDSNGGSQVSAITQDYNTSVSAPTDPTRIGYTFAGWTPSVPANMPAENITLTANWTINQYTITFDTKGGSEVAAITKDYNAAIGDIAQPTKTGYTFAGWDKAIPTNMPAENVTITANWTINSYKVFYYVDGVLTYTDIYDYNETTSLRANESKVGYTFSGWSTIPANMPAVDVRVDGAFTINQYTIIFDSNGGSQVSAITQDYNTSVSAPADPTRIGYTFAGWTPSVPATMPAENITLTANWTANSYAIAVSISNAETIGLPTEADYDSEVEFSVNPTVGYSIVKVTHNGVELPLVNGVYKFVVETTNNVVVETIVSKANVALTVPVDTEVKITGIVSRIYQEWDSGYGNMSVYLTDNTGTILAFRISEQVELGWEIEVTGKIGSYDSVNQIAQGSTTRVIAENSYETVYTVTEALAAAPGTPVHIEAVVESIETPWNEQYGNISVYISDGANSILVYRTEEHVYVGDKVVVEGTLVLYDGALQIDKSTVDILPPANVNITWDYENITVAPTPTTVSGGEIVEFTIQPSVDYEVVGVRVGDQELTETNGKYSFTALRDCEVVITTLEKGLWYLVTDAEMLSEGDMVIIVAKGYNFALSTNQKTNNRGEAAIVKSGDTIESISESVQKLILKAGTVANTFAFYTGSGYLYAAASGSNYLKTQSTLDANGSWKITINANGVASVVASGENTNNILKYNDASKLFAAYTSGQKDISIYKYSTNQQRANDIVDSIDLIDSTLLDIELPQNVGLVWSIKETTSAAIIDGTTLKVYPSASQDTNITLVATVTIGEKAAVKEFDLTIEKLRYATATYNLNGGLGEVEAQTEIATSTITLPTPDEMDGYRFLGWSDGTNVYVAGAAHCLEEDIEFVAVWEKIPTAGDAKSFQKVTSSKSDWSGKYLIVYEAGKKALKGSLTSLDATNNNMAVSISNGQIVHTDTLEANIVTIAKNGSSYTIQTASGYYIGQSSNANGLKSSKTTKYANTISMNSSDKSINFISGGAYLRFNASSDQNRFRYFKSGTYANQKAIHLYELVETVLPSEYNLTFNSNGGSSISKVTAAPETTVKLTDAHIPTKVGHTFDGWYLQPDFSGSKVVSVLLTDDVTLYAKWNVNSYNINYYVEGALVHTDTYDYNAAITPIAVEDRIGYTFSWENLPTNMPANNVDVYGTYSVNSYDVIYVIDGEEVHKDTYTYGASITPYEAPAKVGHTFSGWSAIPATMPAENIEITGTYNVNSYELTYVIDGEEVHKDTYTYGASITPYEAPAKVGHTFSGWSTIPATMPAENIEITGTYNVNSYELTYVVDGEEVHKDTYTYGATITPHEAPTKVGYTFNNWVGIPVTMPAEDVIATASWTVNKYEINSTVSNAEITGLPEEADYGTEISFTIETSTGYSVVSVTYNGELLESENGTYTFTVGTTNEIVVTTQVNKYEINNFVTNAEITGLPEEADYGTEVSFTVTASTGYLVASVTYNGALLELVDGTYTFTVGTTNEIVVTTQAEEYTISYDIDGGIVNIDTVIADFLNDYNTASGKSHTVDSFYELGQWGEIGAASIFLYNSTYRAKWAWLVDYIASVASSANKSAWTKFNNFNSQAELNADNGNNIYRIAYELRGWVGQKQYTQNSNFKTADYSQANVQSAIWNYMAQKSYTIESDTIELPSVTKFGYIFDGWFIDGEKVTSIPTGSIGNKEVVAQFTLQKNTFELVVDGGTLPESYYEEVPAHVNSTLNLSIYDNVGNASGTYLCDTSIVSKNSLRWQYKILLNKVGNGWYEIVAEDAAKAAINTAASNAGVTWTHALSNAGSNITTQFTVGEYIYIAGEPSVGDTNIAAIVSHSTEMKTQMKTLVYGPLMPHTLGTPVKEHHTFGGWYTNAEFTGEQVTVLDNQWQDLVLYAKWTSNQYTINSTIENAEIVGLPQESIYGVEVSFTIETSTGYLVVSVTYNGELLESENGTYTFTVGTTNEIVVTTEIQEYTITFDTDGGNDIAPITQNYGTDITAPADPIKEGYTFTGWLPNIPDTMPVGGLTVVAQWVVDKAQVIFKIDEETTYQVIEGDFGTPFDAPADPVKEGYIFAGWDQEIPATIPASPLIITAKWTPKSYEVTFDSNDGSLVEKQTINYNEKVTVPSVPTKVGYTFVEWQLEGVAYDFDTPVQKSFTLTAKWNVVTYTIAYELNDGSATGLVEEYNVETETFNLVTPTLANYTFAGWYETDDFSTEKVENIEQGTTGNKTLYAKWVENNNVQINYHYENGAFNSVKVPANTYATYEELAAEILADFNTYKGSSYTAESLYAVGSWGSPTDDVVKFFYDATYGAKWAWLFEVLKDYTGSENNKEAINKLLASPTFASYQGIGSAYSDSYKYAIAYELRGLVYGAQYTKNGSYHTVDYSSNVVRNAILDYINTNRLTYVKSYENVTLKELKSLRNGYEFEGWYTESTFENKVQNIEVTEGSNTYDLYAKWNPIQYTITYELNDGVTSEDLIETYNVESETIVLPTLTKEGYTFIGWYNNEDFEGSVITSISTGSYGNISLYACFVANATTTVTYEMNGGHIPTYSEFVLGGYNSYGSGKNTPYYLMVITTSSSTVTNKYWSRMLVKEVSTGIYKAVHAQLDGNITYNGEYDYIIGTNTDTGHDAATYAVIQPLIQEVINGKELYLTFTLPASTGAKQTAVKVYESYPTNVIEYKNDTNQLLAVSKKGYTFDGWYAEPECENIVESITIGEENASISLYAKWTINEYTVALDYNDGSDFDIMSLEEFTEMILNDFNTYGESSTVTTKENFKSTSHPQIKTVFDDAEMLAKYKWFFEFAIAEMTIAAELSGDDEYLADTIGMYERLIAGDTVAITEAVYADERTAFRWWVEGLLNETKRTGTGAYDHLMIDYSVAANLQRFYNAQGTSVVITYGGSLPTPTRSGYVFQGWYNDEDVLVEIVESSQTLTAKWAEVSAYIGETPYGTIQDAIDAAQAGDTVKVLAGTHSENLTISTANITLVGPNQGINPNTGLRSEEAILTGKITVSASGLLIDGLAFTGAATISVGDVDGFEFSNNNIYDTTEVSTAWVETSAYAQGFIYIKGTSNSNLTENFEFHNNKFDNVSDVNVFLSYIQNVTFTGNVFNNFDRDAIRTEGGYVCGDLIFTNNQFTQDTLGAYNGIYFRMYGGPGTNDTRIVIENNEFVNIGNSSSMYTGAISARNYQEKGADISIVNNLFEGCYNYIRIRNNGTAANHAASTWVVNVEDNEFIGLPTDNYFASRNGSSGDNDSTCPINTTFGANYYEDNDGNVITDLAPYASMFKDVLTYGTVVPVKPGTLITITFDTAGGTAIDPITQEWNTAVTAPSAPEKEGYTFTGWTPSIPSTMPAVNTNITATWTAKEYTITFDSNGGSAVSSITQGYETEVTKPANPTKEGYTFAGWTPELPSTMPLNGLSVVAQWTPELYNISYILDGGVLVNAIDNYTIETDTFTLENPTKDGYEFIGWTWNEQSEPQLTVTITKGSIGNKEYTANWQAALATKTTLTKITNVSQLYDGAQIILTYNDEASMGEQSGNYRAKVAISDISDVDTVLSTVQIITLVQSGDYWLLKVSDTEYLMLDSENNYLKTSTSMDAKSKWTISASDGKLIITNSSYTTRILQYNASSPRFACYKGTQQNPIGYIIGSEVIDPSVHQHTECPYCGKCIADDCDGTSDEKCSKTNVTLTFDANSGDGTISSITQCSGSEFVIPNCSDFSKDGYTLEGLTITSDGAGTVYNEGDKIELDSNATLYAKWKENGSSDSEPITESISIIATGGSLSGTTITWEGTNFTFINSKGSSSTAIRTSDSDHYRIYAKSDVTISAKGGKTITKVVFTATSSSYANVLVTSANGADYTASASGSIVTITFTSGVENVNFTASAQTRINKIEVELQ